MAAVLLNLVWYGSIVNHQMHIIELPELLESCMVCVLECHGDTHTSTCSGMSRPRMYYVYSLALMYQLGLPLSVVH